LYGIVAEPIQDRKELPVEEEDSEDGIVLESDEEEGESEDVEDVKDVTEVETE
jgi:hypothetical protein